MVAAALATNSVAGQSGDRFNSKSLRGNVTPEALISQTAVCNRLHSVEQQLCRWLLLSHDRIDTDELIMTQELIVRSLTWITEVRASHRRINDQRVVFTPSRVITEELPSFPSILFFEVSTLPIASFARLRTMRLFSKNTLSHARLVVCGK